MRFLVESRLSTRSDGRYHRINKRIVKADNHRQAYMIVSGQYSQDGIVLSTQKKEENHAN